MKFSPFPPFQFYLFMILSCFAYLISGCLLGDIFSGRGGQKKPGGEIWVSEDGVSWDLWSNRAAFGVRTRAPVAVFKDKLWLFGGVNSDYVLLEPIKFYDDVWNTVDGTDWIEIIQNSTENETCPECQGNRRGWYISYAFKNNLWLFGTTSDFYQERMFYSGDGRKWTEWDSIPAGGRLLEYTQFNNKLWAVSVPSAGAGADTEEGGNRIWTTDDGFKWSRIKQKPAFSPVFTFQLTKFRNQLWLLGGGNEIWKSENGILWSKVAEISGLGINAKGKFMAFRDKLWIFGKSGFNYEKNEYFNNAIWQSDNGIKWNNVQINPKFGPRHGHSIIEFQGKLWVIGGRRKY